MIMIILEGHAQLITYSYVGEAEGGTRMHEGMSYMHICVCVPTVW